MRGRQPAAEVCRFQETWTAAGTPRASTVARAAGRVQSAESQTWFFPPALITTCTLAGPRSAVQRPGAVDTTSTVNAGRACAG